MNVFRWDKLSNSEKQKILLRPALENNENIKKNVQDIIHQVKSGGDSTLITLAKQYDGAQLKSLQVSEKEITTAFDLVSADAKDAIEFAKKQIETNHQSQLPHSKVVETCHGVFCERQSRPIARVGLYIPGGSAPLVSTVLMLAIPAQMAKCTLKILCTPTNKKGEINPHILVAATLCGIQNIYKAGGAQAIAAMAYGTQTISKVDKIFGPGNAWVTQAKMLVAQDADGAGIDMPAGPSEVFVIADDNAHPTYVAADLLSQAEHGVDSQVMLVVLSEQFATDVERAIKEQLEQLSRHDIAKQSLKNSRIIITDDIEEAITISNLYAPEHLIMHVTHPDQYNALIQNAGAVFLGPWSPETVGDYVTGSNHVLPTHGYARSLSGLSVTDFMKFISFQTVTRAGLEKIGPFAQKIAEIEGLDAHKQAVSLRLEYKS